MKGATNIDKTVPIKLRFYVELQDTCYHIIAWFL